MKNKQFYLQEQTINEIKEYAVKNNTTSSEVIEMLWDRFKQSYNDKEKMLNWMICGIEHSMIPYYEELKLSSQRAERNIAFLNDNLKQLISMTAEKKTFGWLRRKKQKKAAAKEVLHIEEALKRNEQKKAEEEEEIEL